MWPMTSLERYIGGTQGKQRQGTLTLTVRRIGCLPLFPVSRSELILRWRLLTGQPDHWTFVGLQKRGDDTPGRMKIDCTSLKLC